MSEHRIPAVERAAEVLGALAEGGSGQIRDLSAALGIPRSTVYRILNSLEAHALVARGADNTYRLGPNLLRLARAVPQGADLVSVARAPMDALAAALAATVKLSVLDQDSALVVAVAEAPQTYSVTTQVGRRFPLHAGAASKVLAAFAGDAVHKRLLAAPLPRHTPHTITARRAFAAVLAAVHKDGVAEDAGEFVDGVCAVAAPVFDAAGACVAALSIPYLAGERPARRQALKDGVLACAARVTRQLGG